MNLKILCVDCTSIYGVTRVVNTLYFKLVNIFCYGTFKSFLYRCILRLTTFASQWISREHSKTFDGVSSIKIVEGILIFSLVRVFNTNGGGENIKFCSLVHVVFKNKI